MTISEVRRKYLEFFRKWGHVVIPSASLVPENDPTTLFTGSGMQPLVPYLLGEKHPAGVRLVNSQKCFRSEDIEEVGDNRHTTFFEMLGNWSLGDYFKEEQLPWLFEFLTKELNIPKERLWVTCFEGDEKFGLPRDTESAKIWEGLGIPKERIHFYGTDKNWWSRTGAPGKMPAGEPGGPDSEIFYEFTQIDHDKKFGAKCHQNCNCGRFMEIGNSVFMEYRKNPFLALTRVLPLQKGGLNPSSPQTASAPFRKGRINSTAFEKLPQRNVDFGGGLERITVAVNDEPDVFKLDVFAVNIRGWEKETGKQYADPAYQAAFRIVADHARAAKMLMKDGVASSNLGRGYVLRRLLRRAILYADRLGIKLESQFQEEEAKFRKTLGRGTDEFSRLAEKGSLSAKEVFALFSSFGFPVELMRELAKEKGVKINEMGLKGEMEKHQEISRAGAEKKFRGGLADTSEMSVKYHTATHLLHQALRDVLGKEVEQKGSNITPERLRFDFAFSRKLTEDEKRKVVDSVNAKITEDLPVHKTALSLDEAKKSGALHFFDEKYPDKVLIHYIGDSLGTAYSKEFCGGPHVTRTGILGTFKIVKEEAVSAGVRRIKAILR